MITPIIRLASVQIDYLPLVLIEELPTEWAVSLVLRALNAWYYET